MDSIKKALNESPWARWGVMLLVSLTMATNYYFYDALSPLKDLMEKNLGFSSSDYGFFMSVYSIPNVFLAMAVIGGIILDKIGIRITGFAFVGFMVLGSVITAYGASDVYNTGGFGYDLMASFMPDYSPALKMMSLGFFFFGLGAETSCVVVSKTIVKWFKGKELALALGANIAIARLGTAGSLIISPKLVQPEWTQPIWFGALLLAIGLLAWLVYIVIDLRFDRQTKYKEEEEEEQFKLADIGKLLTNPSFLFIALLCVTFYSAVFPFIKYAPDLMQNKFGVSREIGGTITSILPFGTIFFTPLFGWICDYKGKSASLMVLGSVLLVTVHLMFAYTNVSPYVPMFILGIAFSLVPAAMWPSVAKIVDENRIGSAYGLMFSIQNIGLWAFPMLIGLVLDSSNPYAQTNLSIEQQKFVVNNNMRLNAPFLDGDSVGIVDKDLKINITVRDRENNINVFWSENHDAKTNNKGEYSLVIGDGYQKSDIDVSKINFPDSGLVAQVFMMPDSVLIETKPFFPQKNEYLFESKLKNVVVGKKAQQVTVEIVDLNNNNRTIWNEKLEAKTDAEGKYQVKLGDGAVCIADKNYFNWDADSMVVQIKTPLDYTNPLLMLSLLGVFGIIFAFLLRWADNKQGYGLEQPNKQ